MTDKQIIINGYDVSGCLRLQDDNISCELGGKCQSWDNCYYKQLKRKEQECERLEEELNDLTRDIKTSLIVEKIKFDQLKKENEELKITNQSYKLHWEVYLKNTEQNLKYKQALTKIKEICNNNDELKGEFNLVDCDKYKYGKHNLANKILQKISEVEDEHNG